MRPGWLARELWGSSLLDLPSTGVPGVCTTSFHVRAGDLNSALRDCTTSAFPRAPSSQPPVQYLSGFHGASLSSAVNSHAVPLT